jgi:hypothetical protein
MHKPSSPRFFAVLLARGLARFDCAVRVPTLAACLAAAIPGCGHPATPVLTAAASTPAASSAVDASDAQAPDFKYHMQATFWQAVAVRDAVIAGDVVLARKQAVLLEAKRFPQLPDTWKYSIAQMQQSAAEVAVAADIDAAAQWTATMAVACGNCHRYSGEVPAFDARHARAVAPEEETLEDRMQRHARVAEDLWTGLLGSEAAWRRGANSLNEAPPQPTPADAASVNEAFALELNQIKALGIQALMARTLERRAVVYGDLITRCAHCHPFARPEEPTKPTPTGHP